LTNAELEQIVDTSDEWIRSRSGIRTRHIAGPEMALSDLAVPAAQTALERAGLAPEDVDLVVMATVTGDAPVPSTASVVQHRLGASHAAAFDLAAACSGFVYALSVAAPLVGVGQYRNAVVIGGDLLSRITDYTDRTTCVLFGDAAAAVVLQPVPEPRGILASYLRSDGEGAPLLTVPAGGSRKPATQDTVQGREHFLRMQGSEVFKFAVRAVEDAVMTALGQAGLTKADISLIIPHQANLRIIEAAAKRLDISLERWAVNIQEYGCTSAASIPLAMTEAHQAGRIKEGDIVMMVAFGGGLTWAATVLRW